jgi:hypothetical protein
MDCSRDECLSQLISHYDYPKLSIIGYVDSARYDLLAQCGVDGQPNLTLGHIRDCIDGPTQGNGLSRLIYLFSFLKQSIIGH